MKAYPIMFKHPTTGAIIENQGMELRDYFAAKAMQPVVDDFLARGWSFANEDLLQFVTQQCYEIADAMIKAREFKNV